MQVQTEKNKITFSCPKCTATLKVPMQLAGVSGPCPKCGGTIAAPRPKPQPQVKTPRPPIQSRPEPTIQEAPKKKIDPLPVTPRISITHGSSAPTAEKSAETQPTVRPTLQEKPPRVEIEDLNEPAIAAPKPDPDPVISEKPTFPQSFQTAVTDDKPEDDSNSFDEIEPATEVKSAPQTAAASLSSEEKTEKLAPLPVSEKPKAAPIPEPTPKAEPKVAAEIPAPTPKPDLQPEKPTEEPRVTVTTLPAAKTSSVPAPTPAQAATPNPAPVSAKPAVSPPAEVKKDAVATVPSPRIQRDARNAARTAAAAAASESTETRPISPVTKPNFLEPQASQTATTTQAKPQPAIPVQTTTPGAAALPRLDASLAAKPETTSSQQTPAPVEKKPTGPTKINLPQLNNGQSATVQSNAAPVEPIKMPVSTPAPKNLESQHITEDPISSPAPDPTAVPVVRSQPQASPAQQPAAQVPEPVPIQTHQVEASGLPPVRDEIAPQPQSLQAQLEEAIAPDPVPRQAPAPAMEQPPQAKPNTARKFFPQRRKPLPQVEEDRGLGNVILEESPKSELVSTESDGAFDDLFGASAEDGEKRKFGLFHAGIIGAVILLTGVAIVLVGNAFGVFDPDETPTTAQQEAATAVGTDKPAVERPPEKAAIENPTLPAPKVASTGVAASLGSNSVTETSQDSSIFASDPETAKPAIPGESFSSLTLSDGTTSETTSPAPARDDTVILGTSETPATIVTSDDEVSDQIKERIEAANRAIETNPSTAAVADVLKTLPPATAATLTGIAEAAEEAISTPSTPVTTTATSDGTAEIQPRPFSTGGPTGEFATPSAAAVAGPPAPAPGTFTPPAATGSRLGKSRQLVETFLEAPTWDKLVPYTYRSEIMKEAMGRYYSNWPYQPVRKYALKFEQMESDPEFGGPFWMYNVSTSDDSVGFPIVVRQENDLLKIDWGIYAEFRDQMFVKFKNGEIAGQQKYKLIIEHLSTYYGSDAEAFTNLSNYYVFRLAPPYGDKDLEEIAFVPKTSAAGIELNKLVPLNSSPLAVTIELENQSFPHGINHLVITKFVTDGWFE